MGPSARKETHSEIIRGEGLEPRVSSSQTFPSHGSEDHVHLTATLSNRAAPAAYPRLPSTSSAPPRPEASTQVQPVTAPRARHLQPHSCSAAPPEPGSVLGRPHVSSLCQVLPSTRVRTTSLCSKSPHRKLSPTMILSETQYVPPKTPFKKLTCSGPIYF